MEDSLATLKVLLFLTCSVHLSSADTHFLQFRYTSIRSGINFPEFTAVGLMDGEQFEYYDSNMKKMILKTEWIQKFSANDDPEYWNRETDRLKAHQDMLKQAVTKIMSLTQAKGNHTLHCMCTCGLDNGTTRGYSQYRYNEEDFISLDLNWNLEHGQGTWTAANDNAKNFLKEWDPKGEKAEYWKDYLKHDCIDQLHKFVPYSNNTVERKDPPTASVFLKHSPSPEVVCHATAFFPKAVNITWRKDGEDVNEDVEVRVTFPNQDGSFQKRSILKVPAEELQKHTYTCVIQHSSLKEELVLEVPKGGELDGGSGGGLMAIIVGVVVTLVVLVAVVAGIMVWKKKNSGFRRASVNEDEVEVFQD